MKRLTYDFELGGEHCWQVEGADNLVCREICERQENDNGCKTCPIARAFDRLAAIEDILGDEYELTDITQVKHGRWIYKRTWYEADECNCSLCGQLMTTGRGKRMRWCPNCGALMDGKEVEHEAD